MEELVREIVPPTTEASSREGYRVLLVEDDPEYGRMVERVLRRGHPPLSAQREERLDRALARLEAEPFDALVVDLSLPDGHGRATLGYACSIANHLPVVVLTAEDDVSMAIDAMRAGAEDYLVKQHTSSIALTGAVTRAIERHRRGASMAKGAEPSGNVMRDTTGRRASSR